MQPKYVTQSQFWLPFVLLDNEAKPISQPHPTPLPFSTPLLQLQKICNPTEKSGSLFLIWYHSIPLFI